MTLVNDVFILSFSDRTLSSLFAREASKKSARRCWNLSIKLLDIYFSNVGGAVR